MISKHYPAPMDALHRHFCEFGWPEGDSLNPLSEFVMQEEDPELRAEYEIWKSAPKSVKGHFDDYVEWRRTR